MNSNVVQILGRPSEVDALPQHLVRLRWRIVNTSGISVSSAWLPQTKHPSLSRTLADFEGKIQALYIDAEEIMTGKKWTSFRIEGVALKNISFKGFFSAARGWGIVGGFEVEDKDGNVYLILRDGTVTPFPREGSK